MSKIIKYFLFFCVCGFCALILGQMEFRGRQIGERVATGVRFPVGYDIVEDTKAEMGHMAQRISAGAPPAFQAARRKLAEWISPDRAPLKGQAHHEQNLNR